eukprot:m.16881 g.16881  ORF g.16881 m.16881 type:complete len:496 (-) comp4681_c0_seq2:165-1652(-)
MERDIEVVEGEKKCSCCKKFLSCCDFKDVKDRWNYVVLLLLYTLQGIPLGLAATIPMLLQDRSSNYSNQATFSLASWPFSLKLLWAPIVDSVFIARFGRRKTWLVPVQLVIAFLLIWGSTFVNDLVNAGAVVELTVIFFMLYFLCATQDIAVDGWALTMLHSSNVDKASVCNSAGQSLGFFASYLLFVSLNDVTVCNKYLRSVPSDEPMLDLGTFFFICGALFFVITVVIAIFKHEKKEKEDNNMSVLESYKTLHSIITLPNVFRLFLLLLTSRFGMACGDAMFGLKLQEFGIPKYVLASIGPLSFPVQLFIPLLICQIKMPHLSFWMMLAPVRLLFTFLQIALVAYTQYGLADDVAAATGEYSPSWLFYCALIVISISISAISQSMFTSQMQFYNKISDPRIGGTYMTLLNTVTNLGGILPTTLYLKVNGMLTDCDDSMDEGTCSSISSRFYYIAGISLLLGVWWLVSLGGMFRRMESKPSSSWRSSIDKAKST